MVPVSRQMSWPAEPSLESPHPLCTTTWCSVTQHLLSEAPTHAMNSPDWNLLLSVCLQWSLYVVSLSSDPGACRFSDDPQQLCTLQASHGSWTAPLAHCRDTVSSSSCLSTHQLWSLPLPEDAPPWSHIVLCPGSSQLLMGWPTLQRPQWQGLRDAGEVSSAPGGHPGDQRPTAPKLKCWKESDQGPPSGHRLFLSATADKGHFQTAGLLHQGWPFLSQLAATVTGTLNLSASPEKISSSQALPFPFASFCSCLSKGQSDGARQEPLP